MEKIKINDKEKLVLEILAEEYSSEWMNCFYFKGILAELEQRIQRGAKDPIMGLSDVRRACRSLAKKGLAEFMRGLFDDEGKVAGSGYCCTEKGATIITPCDVCGCLACYDYPVNNKGETDHFGENTRRVLECEAHYKQSPNLQPILENESLFETSK